MEQRIIIRTPNFIGDTVMMLPALELVKEKYPHALITIVCKAHSYDIFRKKEIHKIIIDDTKGKSRLKKTFQLLKSLRQDSYDLGILFHNSFLSALLFKLARIHRIIGYEKEGRKILLSFHVKILRSRHYVNHYAHLVNSYFGNSYTKLPPMKLEVQNDTLLEKGSKPLVGFVLGGENKGVRRYPVSQSLELFSLLKEMPFHFVFFGDALDESNHSKYVAKLQENDSETTNLTGKTTVAEFIDSIAQLDLLVTIDTAAMHIAAATKTPFLVLRGVGTSAFDTVKPKGNYGHILFRGENYIKDEDAIKAIKPIDIYNEIVQILNKKEYIWAQNT